MRAGTRLWESLPETPSHGLSLCSSEAALAPDVSREICGLSRAALMTLSSRLRGENNKTQPERADLAADVQEAASPKAATGPAEFLQLQLPPISTHKAAPRVTAADLLSSEELPDSPRGPLFDSPMDCCFRSQDSEWGVWEASPRPQKVPLLPPESRYVLQGQIALLSMTIRGSLGQLLTNSQTGCGSRAFLTRTGTMHSWGEVSLTWRAASRGNICCNIAKLTHVARLDPVTTHCTCKKDSSDILVRTGYMAHQHDQPLQSPVRFPALHRLPLKAAGERDRCSGSCHHRWQAMLQQSLICGQT